MEQVAPAQDVQVATPPEYAAVGEHIGALVYFSSQSRNTARFVANCQLPDEGINVFRIPIKPHEAPLNVREPYVLMIPTYGGGSVRKAVLPQIRRFLNDPANRAGIRGVIASGNTNFGESFCLAGDIVARKCQVPLIYYFELMGTKEDEQKVRKGLVDFFHNHPE
ncbi:protein NrdI [Bombiscardovia nodaiensis]|uniref:Protein NrdI n=1 Tax=Bombiscardovia nodaiensis TaxID=2932181 RepID=A0ABM8B6E3_9BIFI|nr:protein NrdI [Bombiscardovia nodaiensis]